MSYCPSCLTEYRDDALQCADCGIALVPGPLLRCPACEEPISSDDVFCDTCGTLVLPEDAPNLPDCEAHAGVAAVAGCVVCGIPLCEECMTEADGKHFCRKDEHVVVQQGYAIVFRTANEYEADMLVANLQGADIPALVFNQHDHSYFVGVGALALVNVMVPAHQTRQALEIIEAIMSESGEDLPDVSSSEKE